MHKLSFASTVENAPIAAQEAYNALLADGVRDETADSCRTSVNELFTLFAQKGSKDTEISLAVEKTPAGIAMQYMNRGRIYNPCQSGGDAVYSLKHMDEISYEFKYGCNALSVLKKL